MRSIIFAALVGVLVSGPVWAKDEKGVFLSLGAGAEKCTEYLGKYGVADLKTLPDGQYSLQGEFGYELGWIQGYATRVNETTEGLENIYGMDGADMAAWLASWCRDNPSKRVLNAMQALTDSLLKSIKFGMEGLEIRNVKSSREVEGGIDLLIVHGFIANISGVNQMVPMIRVALYDSNGKEVQKVIAPPSKNSLEPGTRIGFTVKLPSPPAFARRLEVTFSEAEKTGG